MSKAAAKRIMTGYVFPVASAVMGASLVFAFATDVHVPKGNDNPATTTIQETAEPTPAKASKVSESPRKASPVPSSAPATPNASPSPQAAIQPVKRDRPKAAPKKTKRPTIKPTVKPKPALKPAGTTISGYAFCGPAVAQAQRCIDQGKLTLYYPSGVNTLAGHNYMGYDWMDNLPVGRIVTIKSGGLKGTYKVYGHGWAKRGSQGGTFPSNGLGAAVALQTCTSNGTGFSFLKRV